MRLSRAPPWHFELDIPSGSESLGGWCAVPPSLPPLGYELWEPEEGGSHKECTSQRLKLLFRIGTRSLHVCRCGPVGSGGCCLPCRRLGSASLA